MVVPECILANGVAVTDRRYNGDGSRADAFRASAARAYNVIWHMGRAVGHSDALIDEDIGSYQRLMSEAFVRDDAYFQRARSECIKLGLMASQ